MSWDAVHANDIKNGCQRIAVGGRGGQCIYPAIFSHISAALVDG